MVHTTQIAAAVDLIPTGYPNRLIPKGDTVRQNPEPILALLVPAENPKKRLAGLVAELASVG